MAEKEERILIGADIESPCVKCKEIDFCDANCEQYEKFAEEFKPGALKVLYRQEAINRMAKAMCHSPFESCEGCIVQKKKRACKQALEGMKDLAEVALDALLGESND